MSDQYDDDSYGSYDFEVRVPASSLDRDLYDTSYGVGLGVNPSVSGVYEGDNDSLGSIFTLNDPVEPPDVDLITLSQYDSTYDDNYAVNNHNQYSPEENSVLDIASIDPIGEGDMSAATASPNDRSIDSRYAFERAYSKWAANSNSLPVTSISKQIQFTSPIGVKIEAPKTPSSGATIYERLYKLSAVYDARKEELSTKRSTERENELNSSSFLKRKGRGRSQSVGRYSSGGNNGLSDPSVPVHDRLLNWKTHRDSRVDELRRRLHKARDDSELAELTFHPSLLRSFYSDSMKTRNPNEVFQKLFKDKEILDGKRHMKMKEIESSLRREESGYFSPRINRNSDQLASTFRSTQELQDRLSEAGSPRASTAQVIESVESTNRSLERVSKLNTFFSGAYHESEQLSPTSIYSDLSRLNLELDRSLSSMDKFGSLSAVNDTLDESLTSFTNPFPKPSYILKTTAGRRLTRSSADKPVSVPPPPPIVTTTAAHFENLHKDSERNRLHRLELDAKYYPPSEHSPRIYSTKRATETQCTTKDVFTRMYEQRNAKDVIVSRLRFYRSLNDTVIPSVTLSKGNEQELVKRLYDDDVMRRVDVMTLEKQRREFEDQEKEPRALKKSVAMVHKKREEALSDIFEALLWSVEYTKKHGIGLAARNTPLAQELMMRYSPEEDDLSTIEAPAEPETKGRAQRIRTNAHRFHTNNLVEDFAPQQQDIYHFLANKFKVGFSRTAGEAKVKGALYTSFADARLLQPPQLAETLEDILTCIRPAVLMKKDFVYIVNTLLDTGHFPPMNSVFCKTPVDNSQTTTSVDGNISKAEALLFRLQSL